VSPCQEERPARRNLLPKDVWKENTEGNRLAQVERENTALTGYRSAGQAGSASTVSRPLRHDDRHSAVSTDVIESRSRDPLLRRRRAGQSTCRL